MAKMTEKALRARDAKRDIGEELLQAVREMKAGKAARVQHFKVPDILEARMRVGLSQEKFANVLGVSTRTKAGSRGGAIPPGLPAPCS